MGVLAGTPATILAHGDLHEQIETLTAELIRQPKDGGLLLKRADLNRLHGDLVAAAADYDQAAALDPALSAVHLGRGQMHLVAGRFAEAAATLDLFLKDNPGHAQGYVIRARAKGSQNHHLAAAADFARAIQLSAAAEPEHYLEQAGSLAAAGPEHVEAALDALKGGIRKLGNIVTLGLQAVELEVQLKRYEEALARLEKMRISGARQEFWLERQGDVLSRAQRAREAGTLYQEALRVLQSHPPRIQNHQSTKLAIERIQQKLQQPAPASITSIRSPAAQ